MAYVVGNSPILLWGYSMAPSHTSLYVVHHHSYCRPYPDFPSPSC